MYVYTCLHRLGCGGERLCYLCKKNKQNWRRKKNEKLLQNNSKTLKSEYRVFVLGCLLAMCRLEREHQVAPSSGIFLNRSEVLVGFFFFFE